MYNSLKLREAGTDHAVPQAGEGHGAFEYSGDGSLQPDPEVVSDLELLAAQRNIRCTVDGCESPYPSGRMPTNSKGSLPTWFPTPSSTMWREAG
ncbi:MAG: hypothetical protein M9926_10000 [Lentimicrobium sp.]|uniref:hypothetical protein n=1 Tax=Lentimicrobium sp. TaxID=2034841 RepID=UPI0025E8A613|nr:hypothetical protein [Lentimicrobium sp.]MCO5257079.1 hypothetical protein [Lentimicrobium sp.]